jgi:hypothetical protein
MDFGEVLGTDLMEMRILHLYQVQTLITLEYMEHGVQSIQKPGKRLIASGMQLLTSMRKVKLLGLMTGLM